MNDWTPISFEDLSAMITQAEELMGTQAKRIWQLVRLTPPEKWELHPWGDQGGGFWVVAIAGQTCLYYNDIENGFNTSPFTQWGRIDKYVCDQVTLDDLMNDFCTKGS